VAPRVFISYKWESAAHNAWVEKLYRDLRLQKIDAKLDQIGVRPGASFVDYMTREIREADSVLFIVTPLAVSAAEAGEGSISFELQISTAIRNAGKTDFTVIPILKEGSDVPTHLIGRRYLDFRDSALYYETLNTLVRWLTDQIRPPELGVNTENPESIRNALPALQKVTVLGYAMNDPEQGETGMIQLDEGNLAYIRKHDPLHYPWSSSWSKDFFEWTLAWDPEHGVIATGRHANSPD
jgi:hypothetical protein